MSVHSFLELVKKEETNGKKKSKKKRNMQRKRLARVVGGMGQIFYTIYLWPLLIKVAKVNLLLLLMASAIKFCNS